MPRKPRLDAPGLVHHVIARGIERRQIFVDNADRRKLLAQLHVLAGGENNRIYAFCLMPNHLHLCVRTLAMPLSTFMRRLLTRYAVYFNRRHRRSGHLFQNRYKSFVVDEDAYLRELIRYIHLNPVRSGIIDGVEALATFPYAGHAALMGRCRFTWFAAEEALGLFGSTLPSARERLVAFMREGCAGTPQPTVFGQNIARAHSDATPCEISEVVAFDERIVGAGSFVASVLSRVGQPVKMQASDITLDELVERVAAEFGLAAAELCSGSRRRRVVDARDALIWYATQRLGICAATIAAALGITPTAVCTALRLERGRASAERLLLRAELS